MSLTYAIENNPLGGSCIKATDGAVTLWIPFDEANTDYQAFLAWVAEGNTAEVVES